MKRNLPNRNEIYRNEIKPTETKQIKTKPTITEIKNEIKPIRMLLN